MNLRICKNANPGVSPESCSAELISRFNQLTTPFAPSLMSDCLVCFHSSNFLHALRVTQPATTS